MLLKKSELEAIASGRVSVVFRRWRRPSVKTGGSLRTAIGLLAIDRVIEVRRSDLSENDAANAGYSSLLKLLEALDAHDSGSLYRIEVRFVGADPRIRLRENDALSKAELLEIHDKLESFDSASRLGDWTLKVLGAIRRYPCVAAAELSKHTGFEKVWLKRNIRRLKDLGLTISHEIGYELSPRGKVVVEYLEKKGCVRTSGMRGE